MTAPGQRLTLRHYTTQDAACLAALSAISEDEAAARIAEWSRMEYRGRYFEVFAIDCGGRIVGTLSLYERTADTVSEGIEIYRPFRRRGYATEAICLAFDLARRRGYRQMTVQVLRDNTASLALHRKLGFQTVREEVSRRGHLVWLLSCVLSG